MWHILSRLASNRSFRSFTILCLINMALTSVSVFHFSFVLVISIRHTVSTGKWQKLLQPNCLSLLVLSSNDFLSVSTLPSLPPLLLSSSAQSLSLSVTVACVFLSLPLPATYRYCIDQTRTHTLARAHTHRASHSFHHWFAVLCSALAFSLPFLSLPLSVALSTAALVEFNPWRVEREERNRER